MEKFLGFRDSPVVIILLFLDDLFVAVLSIYRNTILVRHLYVVNALIN